MSNYIVVEVPGGDPVKLAEVVLDFTGTLSRDGALLPGVVERLTALARRIRLTVMTADTFGQAAEALAGLPVNLTIVQTGAEKLAHVESVGGESVAAIGNGRNDVLMVEAAAIGVAVIGPEGAAGQLIRAADVVVNDIRDALDLLLNPLRLKATLRD